MLTRLTGSHAPLKPTMVKQSLIAHYCSNEAVTIALWPLVFGMFFECEIVPFDCFRGLSFQSLLRQAAREVGRQNGRRGESQRHCRRKAKSPERVVLASYFENCRIFGPSISIGRHPAAEWARRLTELKAQACRPRLPQVPDIRRDDMPGADLECAIGFRPSTPDRRWGAPVRRMVSRLSQIGVHRRDEKFDGHRSTIGLEAIVLSVELFSIDY